MSDRFDEMAEALFPCHAFGTGRVASLAATMRRLAAAEWNAAIDAAAWKIENLSPAPSAVLREYAADIRKLKKGEGT